MDTWLQVVSDRFAYRHELKRIQENYGTSISAFMADLSKAPRFGRNWQSLGDVTRCVERRRSVVFFLTQF